ncbi:phosphodiesterase [Aggregicoccus sp. 17bor-14]|uniref:phosphodiesterase n=1 Tax=Myxococcaceae TaxID=31 RepID=UPI00129D07ED|nr:MULTISPECIES: phosphodiesterase [Myxococcaceae]MBF5041793.1 phosphodiesterase [Simulacricoccus sp. 17bor-14]MRI87574.1 phosphodiesterase [Aggregicoccus sp. 17bor-14]
MLLAQLSDLHICAPGSAADLRYGSAAHLARAVAHLNRLDPAPDAVLCTGDLVNEGTEQEYARLLALLRPLHAPLYVLPGNHDRREPLRRAFAPRGYLPPQGFLHYAVDLGPLRLLALDTLVEGQHGGQLCDARLAWLEAQLKEEPARPTLVALHHPPFATGMRVLDAMGLEGAGALATLLQRHPQVERVLCGHVHRAVVRRFAGTLAGTCPSTMLQAALDLRPAGSLTMVPEPPALQLHLWREGEGLVTHTLPIA